jgi:hypothetical protein
MGWQDVGFVQGRWGHQGSGILFTTGQRILALLRSEEVTEPGTWGIPGGAIPVDPSGHPRDALESALAETREEIGKLPWRLEPRGTSVFRDRGFTYTTFIFGVPWDAPRTELRLNWENEDHAWLGLGQLARLPLHPGLRFTLQDAADRIWFCGSFAKLDLDRLLALARRTPRAKPAKPLAFASALSSPGEIRAFAELGYGIGVTAGNCPPKCLDELARLPARTPIFVDSGAVSEVDLATLRVRQPMRDSDWQRVLRFYAEVVERFCDRTWLVAPDRIGDPAETLRRLRRYAAALRGFIERGATLLLVLQAGRRQELADFEDKARAAIGRLPAVPAVPVRPGATSPEALERYLRATAPARLHLLGLGERSPRLARILEMVRSLAPDAEVSLDSFPLRGAIGRTGGPGGGARRYTAARQQAGTTARQAGRAAGVPGGRVTA